MIGNLVKSIRMADYPSDLIDTYVVINNTTDNTSAAAEAEGAKVIDCDVPVKTKAEVLRFAFEKLRDHSEIDTYVIFDADNVVDPAFFTEINKAHAAGFKSAQGKRTGKNLRSTWVSNCYEIYYTMQNAFFNHPRNSAKLSAAINGTGWTIDKSVMDANGFDMTTITEDQEFTIWCSMNDIKIAYCSKALVYDEFTTS
ncbi:MAG: glycosyltransferase, partial [Mogibacterium sp.]|nr:glycosyltransferase [Mogibacterium sp.]